MSDCCPSGNNPPTPPRKHKCPVNGIEYAAVPARTILHHLEAPWRWAAKEQGYYFCADPDCEVVYFGEDGSVILKAEVRTVIGIKERSPEAPACYCFGVSKAEALSNPAVRDFVVRQTGMGWCSCESSNPSGRCCLKDFPHPEPHREQP